VLGARHSSGAIFVDPRNDARLESRAPSGTLARREARRLDEAPIGVGSAFDLVARFGGRDVPLRYEIVEYDSPRRVVLEAWRPGFVSRDTITVEPAGNRSVVHYDATLAFAGLGRLLDPVMQR